MAFMELFVQYIRSSDPEITEQIDTQTLLNYSNKQVFLPVVQDLSFNEISGLFWIYRNLHGYWESSIVEPLEERISKLLRQELTIQKSLDKDVEADVQEGLQTMNIHDLEVIEHYYNIDPNL